MDPTDVAETDLPARLVQCFTESLPTRMRLRYTAHDPCALRVAFHTSGTGGTMEWVFSRDLLADGLHSYAGVGDVRVWPGSGGPDSDVLYIVLGSPGRSALLEAPRQDVQSFLQRTLSMVPMGAESEQLDVDNTLARLFTD
ncbi:SsgA family sporulation/cell division regulator [Streptomyces cadmiisoli]|uniref:SsgA family sporulation/cell division regulator n=1 Tax=Streptomyces cadmiisoli TaxID=2184053 RepID=UPI003D74BA2B